MVANAFLKKFAPTKPPFDRPTLYSCQNEFTTTTFCLHQTNLSTITNLSIVEIVLNEYHTIKAKTNTFSPNQS